MSGLKFILCASFLPENLTRPELSKMVCQHLTILQIQDLQSDSIALRWKILKECLIIL